MVAMKYYVKDGHEFTIPKLKKMTGIGEYAARRRLKLWVAGKITLDELLAPKSFKGRGCIDVIAPTPEEIKLIEKIPGPTELEKKYL